MIELSDEEITGIIKELDQIDDDMSHSQRFYLGLVYPNLQKLYDKLIANQVRREHLDDIAEISEEFDF